MTSDEIIQIIAPIFGFIVIPLCAIAALFFLIKTELLDPENSEIHSESAALPKGGAMGRISDEQ